MDGTVECSIGVVRNLDLKSFRFSAVFFFSVQLRVYPRVTDFPLPMGPPLGDSAALTDDL